MEWGLSRPQGWLDWRTENRKYSGERLGRMWQWDEWQHWERGVCPVCFQATEFVL
jgi:hypothetical protein